MRRYFAEEEEINEEEALSNEDADIEKDEDMDDEDMDDENVGNDVDDDMDSDVGMGNPAEPDEPETIEPPDDPVATANLVALIDPAKVEEEDVHVLSEATGSSEAFIEKVIDLVDNSVNEADMEGAPVAAENFSRKVSKLCQNYTHRRNFSDMIGSVKDNEEKLAEVADIIPMLADNVIEEAQPEEIAEKISDATGVDPEGAAVVVEIAQQHFARMVKCNARKNSRNFADAAATNEGVWSSFKGIIDTATKERVESTLNAMQEAADPKKQDDMLKSIEEFKKNTADPAFWRKGKEFVLQYLNLMIGRGAFADALSGWKKGLAIGATWLPVAGAAGLGLLGIKHHIDAKAAAEEAAEEGNIDEAQALEGEAIEHAERSFNFALEMPEPVNATDARIIALRDEFTKIQEEIGNIVDHQSSPTTMRKISDYYNSNKPMVWGILSATAALIGGHFLLKNNKTLGDMVDPIFKMTNREIETGANKVRIGRDIAFGLAATGAAVYGIFKTKKDLSRFGVPMTPRLSYLLRRASEIEIELQYLQGSQEQSVSFSRCNMSGTPYTHFGEYTSDGFDPSCYGIECDHQDDMIPNDIAPACCDDGAENYCNTSFSRNRRFFANSEDLVGSGSRYNLNTRSLRYSPENYSRIAARAQVGSLVNFNRYCFSNPGDDTDENYQMACMTLWSDLIKKVTDGLGDGKQKYQATKNLYTKRDDFKDFCEKNRQRVLKSQTEDGTGDSLLKEFIAKNGIKTNGGETAMSFSRNSYRYNFADEDVDDTGEESGDDDTADDTTDDEDDAGDDDFDFGGDDDAGDEGGEEDEGDDDADDDADDEGDDDFGDESDGDDESEDDESEDDEDDFSDDESEDAEDDDEDSDEDMYSFDEAMSDLEDEEAVDDEMDDVTDEFDEGLNSDNPSLTAPSGDDIKILSRVNNDIIDAGLESEGSAGLRQNPLNATFDPVPGELSLSASTAGAAMAVQNELATVQGLAKVPVGESNFSRTLHKMESRSERNDTLMSLLGNNYIPNK